MMGIYLVIKKNEYGEILTKEKKGGSVDMGILLRVRGTIKVGGS